MVTGVYFHYYSTFSLPSARILFGQSYLPDPMLISEGSAPSVALIFFFFKCFMNSTLGYGAIKKHLRELLGFQI